MTTKLKAAATSISINVILLISKIIAAIITGSVGLFAECVHSLFDLFSSVLAYFGIKKANEPHDETHHYGHDKFESLSSFLQSLFIILTALFVLYEVIEKILHPVTVENSEVGIILMIISIPATLLVSRYLAKIAKQEGGSQALEADSAHFTTDVLGSVAVLIGLILVKIGYPIGDILAAVAVAMIMLYIAFKLIKETFLVFMDYSPDKETMHNIRASIECHKNVSYHNLRARRAGNKIFVDVHIQVNKKLSIVKAHEISGKIKHKLKDDVPAVKEVHIHIEPKK